MNNTEPRVWVVTLTEYCSAESVIPTVTREPVVFADTEEGYNKALAAFQAVVADRVGPGNATYEYGQFGLDGRTEIIVRDSRSMCDDSQCGEYSGDTYSLKSYNLIG